MFPVCCDAFWAIGAPSDLGKVGKKVRQGVLKAISGQAIRLRYKKPGLKPLPVDLKKRRVNIALAPHWHAIGKSEVAV
jgi:hypothetical protein